MLEIAKLVPEILRHFELDLVDPARYVATAGWLVVQSGLDVKLRVRNPKSLDMYLETSE